MCGRYTIYTEDEVIEMRAIIQEISRKFGDGAVNVGEIRPTNTAPVLELEDNHLAAMPAYWGFPKWDGKGVNINARTDKIIKALDNPDIRSIWREPILTRRCVIPSTGFYEWATQSVFEPQLTLFPVESKPMAKEPKVKLLFHCLGEEMLYMAGMMRTIVDKDGRTKDAFVILTTDANKSMVRFHDRMPVILSSSECAEWISDEAFMREVLNRSGPELEYKIAG